MVPIGVLPRFGRRVLAEGLPEGSGGERDSTTGKSTTVLRHFVHVIGQGVRRDVKNDLDDLCVVIARQLDRPQIVVADMTAGLGYLCGEVDGGIGFGIVRMAFAIGEDLGVVQFGEVLAQVAVRRKTIGAAVDLCHGQGNTFAGGDRQGSFAQGGRQAKIALQ